MIRVSKNSINNQSAAWIVRDALARHPCLGGASARIQVDVEGRCVILHGWTLDEQLKKLAIKIAQRAAGSRPLRVQISTEIGHRFPAKRPV